jgi:hypothetical protein
MKYLLLPLALVGMLFAIPALLCMRWADRWYGMPEPWYVNAVFWIVSPSVLSMSLVSLYLKRYWS